MFTSNVQCIPLAAGRRIEAGDATDQWRDQWRRRLERVVQQQGVALFAPSLIRLSFLKHGHQL